MKNLLNPRWLLIINTLPVVLMMMIFLSQYNVIQSLLSEESVALWKKFGFILLAMAVINFAYNLYLIRSKRNVSALYGFVALLSYIPFLYLYGVYANVLVPFSIPRWMIQGNSELHVGTFLMPTLAYSVFVLVSHFTHENKEYKAWKNFMVVIIVPACWYFYMQVIFPFWKPVDSGFVIHSHIILVIIATLIFLFFLVRGVYILALKKSEAFNKYQLLWKIPISIVFPLFGLALNNGEVTGDLNLGGGKIFGDFSNHWFYILALVNGVFICLPNLNNKNYRIVLFLARSITLSYTFYFFLVFLPFLPLSVLAIIFLATGILMLTPLVLFVIHASELARDYKYLMGNYSRKYLLLSSVIAVLSIPVYITVSYSNDKLVLNETLDYLYKPDYSKAVKVDEDSLSKTLAVLKSHKTSARNTRLGNQTPYLSSYFNWLVLDGLTLSSTKTNHIDRVFFAAPPLKPRLNTGPERNVVISSVKSRSKFDESQNAWVSWIDLELKNNSEVSFFSEYTTNITLPTGTWISDYYLYVGDKKEMGILAEKKSAMWIYSNILSENRDPGILYYLSGNRVAFRVFPFSKDEVRKTGIEFIHKDPVVIEIDGKSISLGNNKLGNNKRSEQNQTVSNDKSVLYVSPEQKSTLNSVHRLPYYHFMVDVSHNKKALKDDFIKRIDSLLSSGVISEDNAKISFVGPYISTYSLADNWKKTYAEQSFNGGYFLGRAIKTSLVNAYREKEEKYPVIVAVTDNIANAIINGDFSDFQIAFPESDLFYHLMSDAKLKSHSLIARPHSPNVITGVEVIKFDYSVLAYSENNQRLAYLRNNSAPSIVLRDDVLEIAESDIKPKKWNSALLQHGMWLSHVLHPERTDIEWLSLVKYSFLSKVMTPVTSYLVVENDAQKAMLKKKQDHVLSSNTSLDLGEDVARMSEPNLFLLIMILILVLWIKRYNSLKPVNS